MIRVALHHLKPEGKSETASIGNIERDVRVSLNSTLSELRFIVIEQLNPLWAEWSCNHSISLYLLEMHKAPKMILYDPRRPSHGADEPVLQEFFLRSTTKDPVPKFYANARVSILLVMTNVQFEEVLLWQEQQENVCLHSVSHARALLTNVLEGHIRLQYCRHGTGGFHCTQAADCNGE
ncbi:hypothetical protein AZE42_08903 [Rhizopogon vesiculosus]|uniref:Uncharacterized protein n=1 Tax=Rhizopogon vesiculosus TaxID=180088 RepID=A0A1J8PHY5_9AGAM|nr:hypothetical protein AZE42_08903 [Rhizopogon vesiculosus]